ncbi:MAG: bidirectional hydrogenase complex protein HoxE [Anaerolineae bacterium]|nr:bidirectional hydrogenase complex protein HoxE [Anaerolineae bacterium]
MSSAQSHPSGDARYTTIDRTIKLVDYQKDALLEVLNAAQETFGYLSEELLIYISRQLDVSLSKVYGVSTFYHMFTFTPLGEHNCIVCTGTACHVKGADRIVQAMVDEFRVAAGETTADGLLSLNTARCLGSCGLAPVTVLDGQVRAKETPEAVIQHVKEALV